MSTIISSTATISEDESGKSSLSQAHPPKLDQVMKNMKVSKSSESSRNLKFT